MNSFSFLIYDWQLALTAAPPSSEIFVFTDAPAKDAHLKSTITALIENTKSVVSESQFHHHSCSSNDDASHRKKEMVKQYVDLWAHINML